MTPKQALQKLKAMTDKEFNIFLKSLPQRVQIAVRGGLVDWKQALPQWYIKLQVK